MKVQNWNGHDIRFVEFELHPEVKAMFEEKIGIVYVNDIPMYLGSLEDDVINSFADCFDVLKLAKQAFGDGHDDIGDAFLKVAESICPPEREETFWSLRQSVMVEQVSMKARESKEYALQHEIEKHPVKFFGTNSKIIKREFRIGKKSADFLIEREGEKFIVECKRGKIHAKALEQIKKYLEMSGVKKGILVGESCDINLPENISFISFLGKWN